MLLQQDTAVEWTGSSRFSGQEIKIIFQRGWQSDYQRLSGLERSQWSCLTWAASRSSLGLRRFRPRVEPATSGFDWQLDDLSIKNRASGPPRARVWAPQRAKTSRTFGISALTWSWTSAVREMSSTRFYSFDLISYSAIFGYLTLCHLWRSKGHWPNIGIINSSNMFIFNCPSNLY